MQNFIITIGREFGTGGRQIANKLGELLGVKVYDKKLLEELKQRYNLTTEEMDRIRAHRQNWWDDFTKFYQQAQAWANRPYYDAVYVPTLNSELIYEEEERILTALAEKESCVILGRTGFHIFRNNKNAFKVFLIADKSFRRDKVARRLNINEGSADLLMNKVDEARENFTLSFSGKSRYDARNYDLVLNVTGLAPESIAQFIADCVQRKMNEHNDY
ncbi:MAG: cytidylate kinase-like family protein [Paludibacteraceae bacterium]|nr:cytidylate kinase-like family protein [Paludibacteraceae bacterium]MBR1786739.1 cytidylate kinase-like family protein [Paludibacteraceae bacterium]